MSYILEALKKSDKKRQEGQVPDLHTVQIDTLPPGPKRGALWPYLLLAVLALNAIALTAFLYFRQPEEPPLIARQPPEKQTASTVAVEPKQKAAKEKLPPATSTLFTQNTSPPIVKKAPGDGPVSLSANNKIKTSPDPAEKQTPTQFNDPGKTVVASKAVAEEPPDDRQDVDPQNQPLDSGAENDDENAIEIQEDAQIAEEPDFPEAPLDSEEQFAAPSSRFNQLQEPLDSPPPSSPQTASPPIRERDVLDLLQLPSSIQQDLPEFHIAAHVYSKKPASRLVSVNKRVLREGHTLSPGLKVEEITTDGVIFSYKDYFFKVNVF